jgi:hypothetical protein
MSNLTYRRLARAEDGRARLAPGIRLPFSVALLYLQDARALRLVLLIKVS